MTKKINYVDYILIFLSLISILSWTNPIIGKYFRFIYLLSIILIFFEKDFFKKFFSNIKNLSFVIIFLLLNITFVFFKNIEIDITHYIFSSILVCLSYIYIVVFFETLKKNISIIFKFYIYIFLIFFCFVFLYQKGNLHFTLNCHYLESNVLKYSVFGENSHIALLALPIGLYAFIKLKNNLSFLLLLILSLFFQSITLMFSFSVYIILSFLLKFLFKEPIFNVRQLPLIMIFVIIIFGFKSENCSNRIIDLTKKNIVSQYLLSLNETSNQTSNETLNEDQQQVFSDFKKIDLISSNLSSQVIIYNFLISINSIIDNPFGVGINNYNYSHFKYQKIVEKYFNFDPNLKKLNNKDGGSLLFKFITEFGVLSLFILYFFINNLYRGKMSADSLIFLLLGLLMHSVRGVGYFNGGALLYILFIYYIYTNNKEN